MSSLYVLGGMLVATGVLEQIALPQSAWIFVAILGTICIITATIIDKNIKLD
jgi:hypothetical protein